jgi:antigen 43
VAVTTYTWTTATSGNFNTATNWSPTGFTSSTSSTYALIEPNGSPVITVAATFGVFTLDLEAPSSGTNSAIVEWQSTARTLTVGNTSTGGEVIINAGTVEIQSAAAAGSKLTIASTTAGGTVLAVGSSGTLIQQTGTITDGSGTTATTTFAGTETLSGGVFTDPGSLTISGGTFTESGDAVTITGNSNFTGGSNQFNSGTFTTGTLTVGSSTLLTLGGGTVADSSGGIANSGTIKGSGTLGKAGDSISGSGIVDGSGGVLDVKSNVASSVVLQAGATAGSTLELEGSVASGGSATFNPSPAGISTLDLHTSTAFNSFNGGGATVANMDFIASSSTPTVVQQIDAETVAFSSVASATLTNGNTTITLFNNGNTVLATFTLSGTAPAGTPFVDWKQDAGTGTDVFLSSVVCYASGTRILTADGEKSVEDIVAGDTVMTLVGEAHAPQPVKWVGERRINVAAHPRPELVAPVRIQRNAFGAGLPARDLLVSPDHCVFVDGKLIPAKLLINGMSVVQERDTRSVQYFHIELDHHAVLLAEGLPAESYLDTGNRAYFTNSGLALVLHPEFHVNAGLKCWEDDACAPLAVDAETVEPVWRKLAARAESLGHSQPSMLTTEDSDLRLVANGRTIRPVSVSGDRYTFVLPIGASDIRLTSRTAIPSDRAAWLDDWRRLGVAVKRIVVRSGEDLMDIPADHPALREGWYKAEGDAATIWRWTDGNARLPIASHSEAMTVEVHVGITAAYPAERLAA